MTSTNPPTHLGVVLLPETPLDSLSYSFRKLLRPVQPETNSNNAPVPAIFTRYVWPSAVLSNTYWHFFYPSPSYGRTYLAKDLNFYMPLAGGVLLVDTQMSQRMVVDSSPTDMQKWNASTDLSGAAWMKASQIPYIVVIVQRKLTWKYPYYPAITPQEFRETHLLDKDVPILSHEGELDSHNLPPLLVEMERHLLSHQSK